MAHALNNCSHSSVIAELGASWTGGSSDVDNSALVRHASVTQWSFYRPGALSISAGKFITRVAGSNNDKLGDFRGYDHGALTPYLYDGYSGGLYYGPGGTSFTFTTIVYMEQLNVREVTGGSVPYIIVKYYPSATDRTNGTNVIKTLSTLMTESAVTPPTDHTNNQTAKPASASQTINDTFLVADIPAGNIVYLDVYIGNNGGSTVYGRFGTVIADSYDEVTITENQNPTLTGGANYAGTQPSGYTATWPIIHSASTPVCTDSTLTQTNGDTTYSFYLCMQGLDGTVTRTRRVTSCTVSLKLGTTTVAIKTGQALGWNSKTLISGTIPAGIGGGDFSYNDVWTVEVTSITWGSDEGGPC